MRRRSDKIISRRMFGVVLSALLMSVFCTGGVRGDIERLLDARAQALSERNLSRYMGCISKNYGENGKDYEFVKQNVSRYFSALDGVDVRFEKRKIYAENGVATVYQDVIMMAMSDGGDRTVLRGKERLRLEREEDGWKIVAGLFGPPPAAGSRQAGNKREGG